MHNYAVLCWFLEIQYNHTKWFVSRFRSACYAFFLDAFATLRSGRRIPCRPLIHSWERREPRVKMATGLAPSLKGCAYPRSCGLRLRPPNGEKQFFTTLVTAERVEPLFARLMERGADNAEGSSVLLTGEDLIGFSMAAAVLGTGPVEHWNSSVPREEPPDIFVLHLAHEHRPVGRTTPVREHSHCDGIASVSFSEQPRRVPPAHRWHDGKTVDRAYDPHLFSRT